MVPQKVDEDFIDRGCEQQWRCKENGNNVSNNDVVSWKQKRYIYLESERNSWYFWETWWELGEFATRNSSKVRGEVGVDWLINLLFTVY